MIINASNTPRILVRVVGSKQLVVSKKKKGPQDQCLVAIVEQGQGDERELNASLTIYSCTRVVHDASMQSAIGASLND